MSTLFDVNFDEARRQGEHTVGELRTRFRQDLGNARFIGRLSLTGLLTKFRPGNVSTPIEPMKDVSRGQAANNDSDAPPHFAILSASELIDLLQTCSIEQAQEVLDYESFHLRRMVVLEAARQRVGA